MLDIGVEFGTLVSKCKANKQIGDYLKSAVGLQIILCE